MNRYEFQIIVLAGFITGLATLILSAYCLGPRLQSFYETLDRLW